MNPSWMLTCDSFRKNKIDLGDPLLAFAHPHSFTKHSKLERRRSKSLICSLLHYRQALQYQLLVAFSLAQCFQFPIGALHSPLLLEFYSNRSSFWLSLPQFTPFLVICPLHKVPAFCRSYPEGTTQFNGVFMIKIFILAGPHKKRWRAFWVISAKRSFLATLFIASFLLNLLNSIITLKKLRLR